MTEDRYKCFYERVHDGTTSSTMEQIQHEINYPYIKENSIFIILYNC
jgi:hypothetical protein